MLKACWDCVASATRQSQGDGDTYQIRLNGDSTRAPSWPSPQENRNMFVLPKRLEPGDNIIVAGEMAYQAERLTLNLITGENSPDYSNIACQMELAFSSNTIKVQTIQNGNANVIEEITDASNYFSDSNFSFQLKVTVDYEDNHIVLMLGSSFIADVTLTHHLSSIRFLSLDGDVSKVSRLEFQFGK